MGSTTVEQPSPPPQPSTGEAVQAYTENLPQMYETQLEYGPKMTGQQVGMLEEFLPQVTALEQGLQQQYRPQNVAQQVGLQMAYAPQLAAQQRQLQELAQPEEVAAKEAMGETITPEYLSQAPYQEAQSPLLDKASQQASQIMEQGLTPEEEDYYRDIYASQLGTNVGSPIGADYMGRNLLMQQQQRKDYGRQLGTQLGQVQTGLEESAISRQLGELGRRQNVGLSMAGMYNVPQQPQVGMGNINVPGLQPANAMAGYNFPQVQGAMQQGYGSYAGLYGSMYGANAGLQGSRNQMMGNIIGGGLGGLTMGMM